MTSEARRSYESHDSLSKVLRPAKDCRIAASLIAAVIESSIVTVHKLVSCGAYELS